MKSMNYRGSGLGLGWLVVAVTCAVLVFPGASRANEAGGGVIDAAKEAPVISHVPVTTTLRSVPVNISAVINASAGSTITSAVVLVRVTDVGTPVSIPMTGTKGQGGTFNATIPVSMFDQVKVFWYSIDVRDSESRIGSTLWNRVVIIDPIETGGDGSVAASAGAGAGGFSWGKAGAVAIGVGVLAGGAVILEHHNDDSGSPKSGDIPPPAPPPPPKSNPGGGNVTPPPVETNQPPCTTTGNETASYENMTLYCDEVEAFEDILILVCNTCPTTSVSATATWGASDIITQYSNTGCSPTAPKLRLEKPQPNGFISPGDYSISVFVNGNLIDTTPWPPLSDQDCL